MQGIISPPIVAILMPTYNQGAFIIRAIKSLEHQSFTDWHLIIINDGSTDETKEIVSNLNHPKITYLENEVNKGLGYCLNLGLAKAADAEFIGYLPSDDIYHQNHLELLLKELKETSDCVLSFSGVIHNNRGYEGVIDGYPIQLIQVLHKNTNYRWTERAELVTDNLDMMFWDKLLTDGTGIGTGKISCEWVDHPYQRHKIINDRRGGNIFRYKNFYKVKEPIKFKPMGCNFIDECHNFRNFRSPNEHSGLKILLVGELAYNPERIYTLEQKGHKLYSLWIQNPENFNASGSLPFGNIEDLTGDDWKTKIKEIKPDIIYALLNHQAIPLAHEVLIEGFNIPFVWHFKEGPFYAIQNGYWNKLVDLCSKADGVIYNNERLKNWFEFALPNQAGLSFVLDGDLPSANCFTNDYSPLLSESDGEVHTVLAGRPFGIGSNLIEKLAAERIHMHFYGNIFNTAYSSLINSASKASKRYVHTHNNCISEDWAKEFSKYDAGWLHNFKSTNGGDIFKTKWEDLNSPARLSTYACAGLPMIQYENRGHIVHSFELIKKERMGVFFKTVKDLSSKLHDSEKMRKIRQNAIKNQLKFCFDYYADDLISFFLAVIQHKNKLSAK